MPGSFQNLLEHPVKPLNSSNDGYKRLLPVFFRCGLKSCGRPMKASVELENEGAIV